MFDGRTAEEMRKMDIDEIKEICKAVKYKEIIGLFQSKEEMYEGVSRFKHSLIKILPLDPVLESVFLLSEIEKYL